VFARVVAENPQTSCSLDTQPPEQEDRDGEQNEAPIIKREMVSNLLHHLDTHKCMEPDGICSRVWRELAEVLTKPLSNIYQQLWLTRCPDPISGRFRCDPRRRD